MTVKSFLYHALPHGCHKDPCCTEKTVNHVPHVNFVTDNEFMAVLLTLMHCLYSCHNRRPPVDSGIVVKWVCFQLIS